MQRAGLTKLKQVINLGTRCVFVDIFPYPKRDDDINVESPLVEYSSSSSWCANSRDSFVSLTTRLYWPLHQVSLQDNVCTELMVYIFAGRLMLVCPYVVVHRRTLLMSLSLLSSAVPRMSWIAVFYQQYRKSQQDIEYKHRIKKLIIYFFFFFFFFFFFNQIPPRESSIGLAVSVRQWPERSGFNLWSSHTKDSKNGTWCLLA